MQVGLWAFGVLAHGRLVEAGRVSGCVFLAFVSVAAALGFLVYGGRLFLMLQRFPIESRGRTKKLREARRYARQSLRSCAVKLAAPLALRALGCGLDADC